LLGAWRSQVKRLGQRSEQIDVDICRIEIVLQATAARNKITGAWIARLITATKLAGTVRPTVVSQASENFSSSHPHPRRYPRRAAAAAADAGSVRVD